MSRGIRTIYPDTGGYDGPCLPFDSQLMNAKSSSGTSVSSIPNPMQTPNQRYPQTTSARKKNYEQLNRVCAVPEPCNPMERSSLYTPRRTASPYGGRMPASAPAGLRPTSPASKGYSQRQHMDENLCTPVLPGSRTTKRQVQFDCEEPRPTRTPQPRTSKSPTSSCRPTSPSSRQKSQIYTPPDTRVADTFDPEELNSLFGKLCPNLEPEGTTHCTFQEFNEDKDEGFLARIIKKIKGSPNPCPLKADFNNRKMRNYSALMRKRSSCFSKRDREDQSLDQLDDLWNPDTFMRWKCIDNWDQHKESLWRSVIQAKLDCPEAHNRSIEDMMYDALKALNAPGGECISFRMIYGILRRNEDMYLNPYIDHFTDEQFLKLIVALNRFYMEDKDKRKEFFDHPPPTYIERIMMKETLGVLDPSSSTQLIARRFWELLLDWYSKKIASAEEYDRIC